MRLTKHTFRYVKNKSGITIAESLISSLILGIIAAAMFSSFRVALSVMNDVKERNIAIVILQEKIEDIRHRSYSGLPAYGDTSFSSSLFSELHNASGNVRVETSYDSNIVRIIVSVSWHDRLSVDRQKVLRSATYVSQNGINAI
ncbi:MAG: type II secretion system protein [Candidatus Omnitrophica bacterium]|nr:type II secretion system protein [Candidatus Omnitrophota bacterium]